MTEKLLSNIDTHTYCVVRKNIKIHTSPDVWSPYSAVEMLNFLEKYNYLQHIEDKNVLDLGTGSGIIGIYVALKNNNVTVSDYSQNAVDDAILNGVLNNCEIKGIVSDCFHSFSDEKFDIILSNPPVQPWLFTDLQDLEHRPTSASWNEAGADGRLVLDALLKDGKKYLNENGSMIISSSTRHGHQYTIQLLNENWNENWKIIYVAEHQLDSSYHAPYFTSWLELQAKDFDLRIYQKDNQGRKFALQTDENGEVFMITSLEISDKKVPVCLKYNGESWNAYNKNNEFLMALSNDDMRMPSTPIDANWYYQYFLIECKFDSGEKNIV